MSTGLNSSVLRNNPVWDESVTSTSITLTGGADVVPLVGVYVIVSNIGANNIWIFPTVATSPGVLVVPGASFETATKPSSIMSVLGTAAQDVVVLTYR